MTLRKQEDVDKKAANESILAVPPMAGIQKEEN